MKKRTRVILLTTLALICLFAFAGMLSSWDKTTLTWSAVAIICTWLICFRISKETTT